MLELYLHIPFCVSKCRYCDFLSGPWDLMTRERYMAALLAELVGRSAECREYRVQSVFFGGGTPSVADAGWIERIMEEIRSRYQLTENAEITIEVNPGTVDREKLKVYRNAGINRLSIGLQSACDEELKILGRIHTYADFLQTYEDARAEGFANINVDVMSGLPGQTTDSFRRTLQSLISLPTVPEHISAYSLIVEEGTPFFHLQEQGKLALPDEETERKMYVMTGEILKANGFHRYEISNYARDGYECIHNCGYWQRTEYLGFGIGSASLMKECRFSNDKDMARYLSDSLSCREDVTELSLEDRMEEFMFLGLRMTEGVSGNRFRKVFGRDLSQVYGTVLQKNKQDGLLAERKVSRSGDAITNDPEDVIYFLTDRGMDVSNYVMAQFLF